MFKFAKGISAKKKCKGRYFLVLLIFHQVIYSLPSISCLRLKLLAVTVLEIKFSMSKFAKGNISFFFLIFTK